MNRNLLQTLTWILIVVILCMGVFATALWVGKNILLPIYDRYQAAVQAQQVVPTQTLWVLVVTATPFQPELTTTPQVENLVMVISTPGDWVPYESEGGVPYNGTTWSVDVAPDELEVFTAGPACIAGVCLPGGTERGSIIILLPGEQVVHYDVTGVIVGSNWHGSYRPLTDPRNRNIWNGLASDRVVAMQQPPNCTPGTGCKVIDVLIVGPNGVVAQWTVGQ